jgi:hypothetical protein
MKRGGNHLRRQKRERWLIRKSRKNVRRRTRSNGRSCNYDLSKWLPISKETRRSVRATADHKFIIQLPERLDFEANYEATASHFRILRAAIVIPTRVKTLDFSRIRFISPSAALVLASEVDRWNQKAGGRLHANVASWHDDIRRLLYEMGYFALLNKPAPERLEPAKNTVFLPFIRGDLNSRDAGKLAKELRIKIEQIVGFAIKRHLLFEGLSEAITNVGQHAYPDPSPYTVRQWWVSASYDKEERRLWVMFYDQGAGIPATLPTSDIYEAMKEYFNQWKDSEKIKAAMEIGRTSTNLTERGKGLQNLVEFPTRHVEGHLSIYSLCGLYRLVSKWNGNSASTATELRDHGTSIGGTLIEWSVKV